MSIAPVVRRVIVCERVEVERAEPGYPYTIRKVLGIIRPPAGTTFPYTPRQLWVFAQFADGAGSHQVSAELVRVGLEEESVLTRIPLPPVHFMTGRFTILSRGYRLNDRLTSPGPGIYEVRIRSGANLSSDELRLEDNP